MYYSFLRLQDIIVFVFLANFLVNYISLTNIPPNETPTRITFSPLIFFENLKNLSYKENLLHN